MLPRTAGETDVLAVDNQVIIRRCEIDSVASQHDTATDDVSRRHVGCKDVTLKQFPPEQNSRSVRTGGAMQLDKDDPARYGDGATVVDE